MRTLDLQQHSEAWHHYRAQNRNASEAPVVMGCSPNTSRGELLRLKATGGEKEFSRFTEEVIFARGKEVEPALRALAEKIIGDDLYPICATSDDGFFGASFDGVTMDERVFAECKQANQSKMAQVRAGLLPEEDRWQVIQQFAVCDAAEECVYIIGDGTEKGSLHLMVARADILADIATLRAGWLQFEADVANYVVRDEAPKVVVEVQTLPAVSVNISGAVEVASNLLPFGEALREFIARTPKKPSTDEEFAQAEAAVKTLEKAEEALQTAKANGLAQVASVDELTRTADSLHKLARETRLALEKLVKGRKEEIRVEIRNEAQVAYNDHVAAINATLGGKATLPPAAVDFAAPMKGKKTVASCRDAVNNALATAKIAATQLGEKMAAGLAILRELASEHRFLFQDATKLIVEKDAETLTLIVKGRIADHEAEQKAKREAEEARIREDERRRVELENQRKAEEERRLENQRKADEEARIAREDQQRRDEEAAKASAAAPAPAPAPAPAARSAPASGGGSHRFTADDSATIAQAGIKQLEGMLTPQATPALTPRYPEPVQIVRPSDGEIVAAVADTFGVTETVASDWLCELDLSTLAAKAA